MITKYIDVDEDKWGIIIIYDFDTLDFDELAAIMDSFGMDDRDIRKSLRVLSEANSGMTISRDDLRMSAVFISPTTSDDEFFSTLSHELAHVKSAIVDYYNTDYRGEPYAYLSGYLMRKAVSEIGFPCNYA